MMIFEVCQGSVLALGFSPDGETLLISGKDGTLKMWSPPVPVRELPTKNREVPCFAYSSKGEMLAFATSDHSIYVHRFADGSFTSLPKQNLGVTGLGFLQSDQTLAVSLGDRMNPTHHSKPLFLWNLASPGIKPFQAGINNGVRSLAVHSSKRLLAWATDHRLIGVRDLGKPTTLFEKKLSLDPRRIQFSPDGKLLAVAYDWRCEIFPIEKRHEATGCIGHKGVVTSLAFTPDGKQLLTGSWDQTVKVWDVATGEEQASFDWRIGRIVELTIAPDGLRAAAGSEQGQVVVWDLE